MPISKWVYWNGRLLPRDQVRINPFDRGWLFGEGLFETIRVCRRRAFRLEAHLSRMKQGAEFLGFRLSFPLPALKEAVIQVIEANRLEEGRIRITFTPGLSGGLPGTGGEERSSLLLFAIPQQFQPSSGIKAIFSPFRREEQSLLCQVKHLSLLPNIWARQQALSQGASEALFLNTQGRLAEGAFTNLFLVIEGRVITPPPEEGLLPGVARQTLIDWCQSHHLPLEIRPISLEEFWRSEECFVTNVIQGVVPVIQVEDRLIGEGQIGAITSYLQSAFEALTRGESY